MARCKAIKNLFPFFFLFFLASAISAKEYLDVTPYYEVKFPEDFFYRKDYRIQWWYFTGHLFDEKGREFGYELTFFVLGVQKSQYESKFGVNNIYISHFAVSDVKEKKFYFTDNVDSGAYDFAGSEDNQLKTWVGKNELRGTAERMHVTASDKNMAIDLVLIPAKPAVLNGEKGYSRKSGESPYIASIYFSYSHLKTEGKLRIGNKVFRMKGKSWFDREISSGELGKGQIGWDWFAIQLADNREILLYILRNKDGSFNPYSSGTFIHKDGKYRHLLAKDFKITILDYYRSEKTGARYPSKWEIKIPSEDLSLRITPFFSDQEFLGTYSTGNYYWEGTCKVEGDVTGRAYVEMTGY
ncbi:MAG: lipocalin-like domain-containing protein [Nitrospirota bacterium]